MQGDAAREVLRVWLYAAAAVLVGAWATPLVYNAGKALAEVSSQKETNGPLEWLADRCRAAAFPSFFEASLLLVAAVFFVPFIRGMRCESDRWLRLFAPQGFRHFALGFAGVATLLLLLAAAREFPGAWHFKKPGPDFAWIAARGLTAAIISAAVQEILFRGIALGIFLRAMRPEAAVTLSAALFALVRFLQPPPGLHVTDPDASGTGFEMLGKIAGQLADPRVVFAVFVPLLGIGCVLGAARLRTTSLALPLGLHTGWHFSATILSALAIQPRGGMWMALAAIFFALKFSCRSSKPDASAT